ncbi:hypothetical protein F3Y22_tig00110482pilonHSYRG00272 [Hibiscus syriacus]|uniref:Uncharacterized protein n=1 Tax=Hibiscus syriacus TaxID=106335 RepID=A0A6A3AH29_HIBSY|nr:uncharacterized protein LOC120128905 [Hibiscus syriacus]KAE8702535.1 hypothetical protein F3Y22_tig00110482pilonHSYRG00272 [Hibiscus syriacus]
MSHRIILRTPTGTVYQQQPQPLLQSHFTSFSGVNDGSHRSGQTKIANFGEFCGGTTADCAAVCCCCPCGLANLLVLVIYKVPAGLCRLKRRRMLRKKGLFQPRNGCGCEEGESSDGSMVCIKDILLDMKVSEEDDKALFKLEKEMWEKFHGTGFWRSPSQREKDPHTIKHSAN